MTRTKPIGVVTLVLVGLGVSNCGESDSTLDSETPSSKVGSSKVGSSQASPPTSSSATPATAAPAAAQSTGCSAAPLSGDVSWNIQSGGRARSARIHLPPRYDGRGPLAFLLNYHGRDSNGSEEELLSGTTAKADAEGFIVAYPEGVGGTWNGGTCCGDAQTENVDDVAFTRDLLDEVDKQLCVDKRRVFATGLSNGAYMVNRLGCELADRVVAIAPVGGPLMMTDCKPSRPVPLIEFHGTADPIVPYDGFGGFFGVESSVADWAKRNGCQGSATQTFANGDTTCTSFGSCSAGADVTLCTTAGGGHQWPGGMAIPFLGPKSDDIHATDAMWTFFTAHPLPQ
jgi:polyhydroxybutyrate depolymerase